MAVSFGSLCRMRLIGSPLAGHPTGMGVRKLRAACNLYPETQRQTVLPDPLGGPLFGNTFDHYSPSGSRFQRFSRRYVAGPARPRARDLEKALDDYSPIQAPVFPFFFIIGVRVPPACLSKDLEADVHGLLEIPEANEGST